MTESYLQIAANNEELARDIVERASARGVTVSTAESLTAGMIASTIADIPGASAVLRGGAVTYCDEIKHRVLGVEQETLDRFSAVSHQTAREMAAGSLELYQSDIAVSAQMLRAALNGTYANVLVNVKEIEDKEYVGLVCENMDRIMQNGLTICDTVFWDALNNL